jgi:hypothetical protein
MPPGSPRLIQGCVGHVATHGTVTDLLHGKSSTPDLSEPFSEKITNSIFDILGIHLVAPMGTRINKPAGTQLLIQFLQMLFSICVKIISRTEHGQSFWRGSGFYMANVTGIYKTLNHARKKGTQLILVEGHVRKLVRVQVPPSASSTAHGLSERGTVYP